MLCFKIYVSPLNTFTAILKSQFHNLMNHLVASLVNIKSLSDSGEVPVNHTLTLYIMIMVIIELQRILVECRLNNTLTLYIMIMVII
jgi:hypothetical protein